MSTTDTIDLAALLPELRTLSCRIDRVRGATVQLRRVVQRHIDAENGEVHKHRLASVCKSLSDPDEAQTFIRGAMLAMRSGTFDQWAAAERRRQASDV